jgi:hypothetical protein
MKKFLLLFAVICTSYSALANATVAQKEWRWRNDDGNETSATWKAPQDVAPTLNRCTATGQNMRLRMVMQVNPDPATTDPSLKAIARNISFSTSPTGPWTLITSSSNTFIFSESAHVADGQTTTNQLTSSGGVNGSGTIVDSTANTTLLMTTPSGVVTLREYEWVIQPTADVQATTYYFKLEGASTFPNTLPSITFEGGPTAFVQNISACESYESPSGDYTWTTSGSYNDTIPNAAGCDSVITTNLTITYPSTGTDVQTACDSYEWIDGITYTESNNTATYTLENAAGCDSIVTLDLTVTYSTTGTDVQMACESYEWIDGVTYTESNNTATYTLENAAGCDSIVTLDLTISYSTTGTDVQTACESYEWIDGVTYTESNNTATYTLATAAGCDSIVTLDLTIGYPTTGTDVQTACESYEWIDGVTYTESNNTATYTLATAAGCDSIVTLDLTISYPTTGTDVQTACDSYEWIDGVTYTESNNTATYTFENAAGCDSIVTLDLTINTVNAGAAAFGAELSADNTDADAYQWIDCSTNLPVEGATNASFTAQANGSYAVIVTENNCTDTSDCLAVTTIGLEEQASNRLSIQVVPNPTAGLFSIHFAQETTVAATVIDVQGKTVYTSEMLYSGEPIDISALENGIYLVRIQTAAGTAVERIVKK